jgi:alkanesulfonate monooxygenase SsuD/methylene tetrahydromethanopterin reductase-like flavin-dependent oxidoreductase (luciferase family)
MPRQLIDVIGVGMARTAAGVTLELLSIERYREGLVVLFRILTTHAGRHDFASPELHLVIADGAPAGHTIWPMGGGGGGGADGLVEYRQSYRVIPAPPPSDRITVEVSRVDWRTYPREGPPVVARTDTGPWRFIVETGV